MGNAGVRMEQRSYCRNLPVIPSRLSLLGRAMTRTFLFTALNVQRSCSGETDAFEGQAQLEYLAKKRFPLPDPVDASFLRTLNHQPGDLFPAIPMVDMDGAPTDYQAYRQPGRAYLINFWATYCIPCRREMPELERLAECPLAGR